MIAIGNRRMQRLVAVTVLSVGVTTAGVAFAQGGAIQTMNVEPSTVEAGGSYVISNDPGSPCTLGQVSGDTGGVRPGAWFVEPDEAGNWSVTIDVPENGPPGPSGEPTPFPEGEYEQHAFCETPDEVQAASASAQQAEFTAAGQPAEFSYEPVTVTVVAPAEEPTPDPEPAPPATPAPAGTPAPAATPAAAEPSFTG